MSRLRDMPFAQLSNLQLNQEFQNAKRKYNEFIKNNPLHKKIFENMPANILNSTSCQYHDDDSFNKLIKDIHPSLSLIHINLQSSTKNYASLKAHLSNLKQKFDIIAISEAGVNNANLVRNTFANYKFYHQNPLNKTTKGGVAVFVKDDKFTSVLERNDLKLDIPEMEDIWLQVDNIIISVLYRHPKSKEEILISKLEGNLETMVQEKKMSIICGDLNINLLNINSPDVKAYADTLISHNFIPTITLPTRITDQSLTLIDHIILYRPVNQMKTNSTSGNLFFDVSDHLPNFILMKDTPNYQRKERPYKRIFSERNINKFQHYLERTTWENVLQKQEVNEIYSEFTRVLSKTYNESFPLVKQSRRSFKDKIWITPAIKVSIRQKNRLYKKYLSSSNPATESSYKKYKNKLTEVIKKAKVTYYKEKLNKEKAKVNEIWQVYSELMGSKKQKDKTQIPKLHINDRTLTDKQEISNAFNSYFATIGEKLANKSCSTTNLNYSKYLRRQHVDTMFLAPTTEEEVFKLIKSLNSNKAAGLDGFHARTIKLTTPYVIKPLTHILNQSINQAIVPDEMRISKVIPIYKKGERSLPGNYRPISLLSIFEKILEKLIYKRLHSFLTQHNILYDYQFGFRSNHSTTHAVIEIVDNIREELDKHKHILGLYLDLSKAFDCVNHSILLEKLTHYGIRGHANQWFKSYLNNRKQKTLINGKLSDSRTVNTGVPQGSVLGPTLFLIYINDIAECLHEGKVRLFADDTNLFLSDKSLVNLQLNANISLHKLQTWFNNNKLTLNTDKTCFTVFSNSKNRPKIELILNNQPIEEVPVSKYLGIHLDEKLNWKNHVSKITSKLNQLTAAFYNLSDYIDKDNINQIYYAYVFPHIKYGIELYGACDLSVMKPLQAAQNKILKILYKKPRRFPTDQLHSELKILKCEDVYKLFIGAFVHQQQHNLLPSIFSNYFILNSTNRNIRTRNNNNLFLPRYNLKSTQKSVKYSGVKIWNSIPTEIRSCNSSKFKTEYKNSLIPRSTNPQ